MNVLWLVVLVGFADRVWSKLTNPSYVLQLCSQLQLSSLRDCGVFRHFVSATVRKDIDVWDVVFNSRVWKLFPWQFWIFLFLCFHRVILMHKWKTHHQSPLMETVQFPLADSQRSSPSQVQVLYFHLKSRNPSKFRSPDLRCSILARPSPSSVISA